MYTALIKVDMGRKKKNKSSEWDEVMNDAYKEWDEAIADMLSSIEATKEDITCIEEGSCEEAENDILSIDESV